MNIDNNIGGSAYQNRSPHIEKPQADTGSVEQQATISRGSSISFVNVLQSTSLANVLWTMRKEPSAEAPAPTVSYEPTSQLTESVWLRQAYTEH